MLGPQFVLFSSLTALRRANFVNRVLFATIPAAPPNRPSGTSIDLSAWLAIANDPNHLIDTLNTLLLHGTMSDDMRQSVMTAVASIPASNDPNRRMRVQTAIYLLLTSSQYQVQR